MKKVIIYIIIILVVLTAVIVAVNLFGGGGDPINLSAPSSVTVENGVLKWSAVSDATDYALTINDVTVIVKETSYDQFEAGVEYSVSIKARNVLTVSKESEKLTFKLAETPKNLVYSYGIIYFDYVDGIDSYMLLVDGKEYVFNESGKEFIFSKAGDHSLAIKAIGGNGYVDSKYSETLDVYVVPVLWSMVEEIAPTGKGTAASPYIISSTGNIRWLEERSAEGETFDGIYFSQSADIDFRYIVNFRPIGSKEAAFGGIYNGENYGIYYLSVDADYAGLFGYIGSRGQVKNLFRYGGMTKGITVAGAISGYNRGLITNCSNYSETSARTVGGIVGESTGSGMLVSCVNYGDVTGSAAGGIAGWNWNGQVSSCKNFGTISGLECSGGIVAYNGGNLANSSNSGNISGSICGGIAGENRNAISSCKNDGMISSTKYGGGIAGSNSRTIKYSSNAGAIISATSPITVYVGGLVGKLDEGTVYDCFDYGDVYSSLGKCAVGYYRSGFISCSFMVSRDKNGFVGNTSTFIGDAEVKEEDYFKSKEFADKLNSAVESSDKVLSSGSIFAYREGNYPKYWWE